MNRKPREVVDIHVREAMKDTTIYLHVRIRGFWRLRAALGVLRAAAVLANWLAGFRTVVEPVPDVDVMMGDDDA